MYQSAKSADTQSSPITHGCAVRSTCPGQLPLCGMTDQSAELEEHCLSVKQSMQSTTMLAEHVVLWVTFFGAAAFVLWAYFGD